VGQGGEPQRKWGIPGEKTREVVAGPTEKKNKRVGPGRGEKRRLDLGSAGEVGRAYPN